MPKAIPFPTRLKKETPPETEIIKENINEKSLLEETPNITPQKEGKPDISSLLKENPEESSLLEETPELSPPKSEFPKDADPENCVKIGGKMIEIKPTKVKYFRNKTASAYGWLKAIPLTEFLTYEKGQLGQIDPNRGADQILYDFLVAALDNSELVRDNYDNMSADDVDRIVKIFGRLNHIEEKEEAARKNREAQAQRR